MSDEIQPPSNPPTDPFQPATVPAPAPPVQAQPQAPAPSAPTPLEKREPVRVPLVKPKDPRDEEIRNLRADLGDAKFKLQTANERIVELENEEPPEPVIRYRKEPMTLRRAITFLLAALVLFTAGLIIGSLLAPKGERVEVEVPVDNPENLKEIELLESQVASLTNEKSSLETEVDRLEEALAEASKPAPAPVVVQPQPVAPAVPSAPSGGSAADSFFSGGNPSPQGNKPTPPAQPVQPAPAGGSAADEFFK